MMIWLVPARSENLNVNVPPYLNAETTVLQDINDTGYFQVRTQLNFLTHFLSIFPSHGTQSLTNRRTDSCLHTRTSSMQFSDAGSFPFASIIN